MNAIRGFLHQGVEKFEQDVQMWGVTRGQALWMMAVPVAIVAVMTAAIPVFSVFVWVTAEDGVVEWSQFVMLLIASFSFARLATEWLRRKPVIGLLCLAIALGIFFVAGEEISWGQRVIGWQTPESLQEINVQNETTLHNISFAHQLFIYAVMLIGMYGTIIPLTRLILPEKRLASLSAYLFIPPLFLIPAFVMPFGYRLGRLLLPLEEWFPHLVFPITKFSEITELCLYFGLVMFAWLNLRQVFQTRKTYNLMKGMN